MDTLRTNHIGSYGYTKNTTPHIDGLSEKSALFKNVITVFPRTTPSAVSLVTGLYPHTHGTRSLYGKTDRFESPDNLNLAEILKNELYNAAAIINQDLLYEYSGFVQGFDTYVNTQSDTEVTSRAISWLKNNRKKNRPVFLMLWYLSPHWPYNPPSDVLQSLEFDNKDKLKELIKRGNDADARAFQKIYNQQETILLANAYDSEIYAVDNEIGIFIDYLKKTGLFKDSIIICNAFLNGVQYNTRYKLLISFRPFSVS